MSMLKLLENAGCNLKKAGLAAEEATRKKRLNTGRLRKDIYMKLKNHNERRMFTLAGVKNLSLGDMHTLLMCCDRTDKYGSLNGVEPFNPDIQKVLDKYSF